jgi:catechol 2,3-dioxygenase-like lactoylglutathione lyase family enzyme
MYDHVSLRVKDFQKSLRFYEVVLSPLGFKLLRAEGGSAGFRAPDGTSLWISTDAAATSGVHVAFRTDERRAVDAFQLAAVRSGGRDNGGPGVREQYAPTYYAAFVHDPDGNNIEAVCHR